MTGTQLSAGRPGITDLVLAAAVCAALLYAFAEPLTAMVRLWDASPMYSYGYTVPVVSAYLLWVARAKLLAARVAPARAVGMMVLLIAIGMATVGDAAGILLLGQLAFLVALIGAVVGTFGWSILRITAPALAYLLLMIPFWDAFTEPLHWPFQNQSASLSVSMMRAVGVPVYQNGTFLTLPGLTLEVARQCSGVNYLIAVVALGLPLAYLYLDSWWRRAALLTFALLIAAFANALRVTLIGILAYLDIGSPLHGPFHILHGLFVAAVGYAALFAGLRILRTGANRVEPVAAPSSAAPFRMPRLEAIGATLIFLSLGTGVFAREMRAIDLNLDALPPKLQSWEWNRIANAPARLEWASADRQIARQYRLNNGATADLYVGYFAVQQQDRELANSRADALHRRSRLVTLAQTAPAIAVNGIELSDPAARALFWYEIDGAQTSAVRARLRTLMNAVTRGQTNGAVVLVSSPSKLGGLAGTDDELQELAAQARQELTKLLATAQPAASRPRG